METIGHQTRIQVAIFLVQVGMDCVKVKDIIRMPGFFLIRSHMELMIIFPWAWV